jgi:hypothetical protein
MYVHLQGRRQDFERGSFFQKSWIFMVLFQRFFLCSRFSRSISKIFPKRGVVRIPDPPMMPMTFTDKHTLLLAHGLANSNCYFQCEKLRKKRNAFMGSLRIAHSNGIDDIDQRILQAR